MALSSGSRLGAYTIVSPLGAGGMGEVYRAHDDRLGRDVAIKIVATVEGDSGRILRFEREPPAIAALNHPNIITIHDVAEVGGAPYIAPKPRRLGFEVLKRGGLNDQFVRLRCF